MENNLGLDGSGLAILLDSADWDSVQSEVDHFDGEELAVEIPAEAEERLAEFAADESATVVVKEYVEIDELTV